MDLKNIKEYLSYDPDTGEFRWLKGRQGIRKGDVAGCLNNEGYLVIGFKGKLYKGHRLAWYFIHGYFPENFIDHINRNPADNRIANLREASNQCNLRNTGNPKTNTSGVKGVCWYKSKNKWCAQIVVNKKLYNLGRFKDFTEAVAHRLAREQCLNWSGCDDNSPAYRYMQDYLKGLKNAKNSI